MGWRKFLRARERAREIPRPAGESAGLRDDASETAGIGLWLAGEPGATFVRELQPFSEPR